MMVSFHWKIPKALFEISSLLPEVKSTIAFKHEYSAASTWIFLSFSIWSVNTRMLSMKETMRSEFIWLAWTPAVARRVGLFRGMGHCAAFSTNNSLQVKRRSATWSVTARSGKRGIFRAHSTAENNNLYMKKKGYKQSIIATYLFLDRLSQGNLYAVTSKKRKETLATQKIKNGIFVGQPSPPPPNNLESTVQSLCKVKPLCKWICYQLLMHDGKLIIVTLQTSLQSHKYFLYPQRRTACSTRAVENAR